jgi:hypothetical protein
VLRELPNGEITLVFRVAHAFAVSGSVPLGEDPSFVLTASNSGPSTFSLLIAGPLVKAAKRFGIQPQNPAPFFNGRKLEVIGPIHQTYTPGHGAETKPAYQMVVRELEKFRVID